MARQYFGDPDACFAAYDSDAAYDLSLLPVCSECGEPIQDDMLYEIGGEFICESCMDGHKHSTEYFIKETA